MLWPSKNRFAGIPWGLRGRYCSAKPELFYRLSIFDSSYVTCLIFFPVEGSFLVIPPEVGLEEQISISFGFSGLDYESNL